MARSRRVDDLNIRSRIAFGTSVQVLGNVISAGISIIVLHVATKHLGPTRYGYLTTVVAIISIFSLLADLGLTTITTRDIVLHPAKVSEILGENLSFRIALSLLAIPVISGLAYAVYPTHRSTVVVGVILMSSDILANALTMTSLTYFGSRTRTDVIGFVLVYGKIVYLAAVLVATWTDGSFFAYIRAYLAGDVSAAAVALCLVVRRTSIKMGFKPRRWLVILRRSLPLGILQIIGNIYIWTGSISLSIFTKPADVAFYGVCTGFIISALNISTYFMGSVMPSLVTAERSGVSDVVQHAWDIMLFVGLLVAAETVASRSELVGVIAGPKFHRASTPLGILGVVVMIMFLNSVINVSAVALDNYRSLLLVQLPSLVAQITLNVLLVPLFGVSGAAIAILGSESCSIIASLALFRRRSGIHITQRRALRLVVAACAATVPALSLHYLWSGPSAMIELLFEGTVVFLVYVVVAEVLGGVSRELLTMQGHLVSSAGNMFRRRMPSLHRRHSCTGLVSARVGETVRTGKWRDGI
jgi:O-antigen/teichoic acid export membrane protein